MSALNLTQENIGVVTKEVTELQSEAVKLADAIAGIVKEQEELIKSGKKTTDTLKKNDDKVKALNKRFGEINKKIKEFNKALEATEKKAEKSEEKISKLSEQAKELASKIKEASTKVKELSKGLKELTTTYTKNKKAITDNAKAYETLAKKIDAANKKLKENKELSATADEGKKPAKRKKKESVESDVDTVEAKSEKSASTAKELDDRLASLAKSQESLAEKTRSGTKALKEQAKAETESAKVTEDLKASTKDLADTITDSGERTQKSAGDIDLVAEASKAIGKTFEDLEKSNGDLAGAVSDVTTGFNMMRSGFDVVKTGFTGIGQAIKSSGLWLLQMVLEKVYEYFTKNEEGIRQFQGGLAVVQKVIGFIKDALSAVKDVIIDALMNPVDTAKKIWGALSGYIQDKFAVFTTISDTISNAFKNPGEALKKIWNLIIDNLVTRFKGIKILLDGVFHLDFRKMTDGVAQVGMGITNVTDKVTKSAENLMSKAKSLTKEVIGNVQKIYQEGYDKPIKTGDDVAGKGKPTEKPKTKRPRSSRRRTSGSTTVNSELEVNIIAQDSQTIFNEYNKNVNITERYFNALKQKHQNSAKELEAIEEARLSALRQLSEKYQNEDKAKLERYTHELNQIAIDNTADAKEKAILQLQEDTRQKLAQMDEEQGAITDKIKFQELQLMELRKTGSIEEIRSLENSIKLQQLILQKAGDTRIAFEIQQRKKEQAIKDGKDPGVVSNNEENKNTNEANNSETDPAIAKILQQQKNWKEEKRLAVEAATAKHQSLFDVEAKFAVMKINLEAQLISAKMHKADGFIDAVLKNTKKESAIYKAAFIAKKATAISDTIVTTSEAVMKSFGAYSGFPFIGQALGIAQAAFMAAQGASSIASIVKQKPGMARGGQFISDGRGAVLPGYSRTDDTNAYLRSGEAVVVSEAMRNPWARNLVSAINVAHGGRDFSVPNGGRGYAIGGIFTDGGNANRYYSAPVNDQKDLANTLAYQMINNFPPIYVDVKDVNNQQNILAQTVNRVTL
ncbi:hypothetical protein LLH06_06160 [Mucilaginibacter daejeonensis]|uniref:hypothetical protein n=1 Tax=Mucilaginibacter daejeonensis TaxID=398049 RepID=UPI001D1750D1|nr:hypothetical protein [Mucilaginibacter daejeonensis]UEG54543.1 hypothetical protein LLH06_06160 [Mucilaginibacter daejeonensis]